MSSKSCSATRMNVFSLYMRSGVPWDISVRIKKEYTAKNSIKLDSTLNRATRTNGRKGLLQTLEQNCVVLNVYQEPNAKQE